MRAPEKLTATPDRSLETLERVGGHVALDFVNTVHERTSQVLQPYLHSYDDLLEWCRQADLIGPVSIRYLSAGSDQAKAAAYKESQALNTSLYALFGAAARGEVLPQASLDHLNLLVQKTVAWRNISSCTDEGRMINCGWNFKGAPPVAVLGPIVWRAMELLENGPLDRIKECPPPHGCGWLFMDLSKNRSRQWCSMKTCGNASKVRRFRERQRA